MRKIISVIVLAASLAGCATSQYGSFVKSSPAVFDQKMATDTVTQLVKLYPPATTRLELQQATPDTFGIALVNNLRAQGYAVMEYKPVAASATPASATAADGKSAVQPAQSTLPGYPLRYVLDQFSGTNMYRVTVLVGSQSLTRAYTAQNDTVLPAGAWVRKE
ncbi:conjugal transfer protein TrbH [Escherichia coli]|nr:conjugal transfer protein TrbH [Escherichia coli]